MNQIISVTKNSIQEEQIINKKIKHYKFVFFFSILIITICIIIYFFINYNSFKKQKISKKLIDNFNITTLYSNSQNSSFEKISNNSPFVIGIIQIDKINLTYPILSNSTEELLKISPCRFSGPMPNEIGNLCIAGHNYANNSIFGNLNILDIGDIVEIYDLSGNSISYFLYNKEEVVATNISCTNQNTNGKRMVTLVTCNTLTGNRIIYKCLEKN